MTKLRLVNLLDDFALGGVSRALTVFGSSIVEEVATTTTIAINEKSLLAPRIDADIIIMHFPPNWRRILFLASLRLRNPRARLIHVEHSYTRAWESLKVPDRARFRTMLKITMRLVDDIVCVSRSQAEWLAEAASIKPQGIKVIYPYVENAGLQDMLIPNFARSGRLCIGAYGRFGEQKGFDLLINRYKSGAFGDVELLIGGFGHDETRLHEVAANTPGIRFYGKVESVADFLSHCDVVAVPSRWEAFGLVATEARQAGRPIFVAPVDGLPEQVGKAGQVVDFTSDQAIRDAMSSLDCQKLDTMAQAARRSTEGCGQLRQQEWAYFLANGS